MNKLSLTLLALMSTALIATPVFAASPDLVARYNFNGNTNNVAQDSSGNNLNGLTQNVTVVQGRYGNAYDFSNGGYVEVADNSVVEPVTVAVEAWVKAPSSPGSYQYVLSKGASGCNSASYALYTGPNGGLQFYISNGTSFVASPDAGSGMWDGNWHYVTGTFDGSTVRLYVDGQEMGNGTPSSVGIGYNLANGNDFYMGKYIGTCTFGFDGQVDEVRVWDRALTASEVSQHFGSNSVWTDNTTQ